MTVESGLITRGQCGCRVEVPITRHLPHRSRRAAFLHRALVEWSNAIVGLDATDPQARCFSCHAEPGTESGACVAAYLPLDRPPSLPHLRHRCQSALFDASSVLRGRPTPRLFLDSFVSSTSCRGPGSTSDCGPNEVSQVPTRSFHS